MESEGSFGNLDNHEYELQNNKGLLKSIIDAIPDYIFYMNAAGVFIGCNRAYAERVGLTEEEIVGKTCMDIVKDKKLAELYIKREQDVLKTKSAIAYEETDIRDYAKPIDIEFIQAPFYGNDGDIIGVVGIARDITLRKKTLIENQEKYKTVVENMQDTVLMYNPQMIITYVHGSEKCLGYTTQEIIGKSIFDFSSPDTLSYFKEKVNAAIEYGSNVSPFETRFVSKDNKEKYIEVSGRVIKDKLGEIIEGIAILHDITERKKYEEKVLKEREKAELLIKNQLDLLNNIIENLEVGFVRYSYPEYKIIDINNKAYRDLKQINPDVGSLTSVIGMNKFNIFNFNKDEEAKIRMNIQGIIDKKVNSNFDYRKIIIADKERYFKIIHQPLLELDNKITEVIDVVLDVTEEVAAKNDMIKTIKIQEELFANVSHELKTPLNVIFSADQLMELYLSNDLLDTNKKKITNGINIIKQNCYRLTKLINNIVDLSKIESGFYKLNLSNENIVQVTEDVVQSVSEYIKGKGLSIIFDTDTEEKIIACDPEKIERIILNLLSNAIKFSNPGGSIFVNIFDKNDTVEIWVQDTGVGIEGKYLNDIFERFQQVDKSLSRNAEGSGIGLSLVKSIVEMHGGNIDVESEVGKGSIFKIKLPVRTIKNTEVIKDARQMNNRVQMINVEFSDIYSM